MDSPNLTESSGSDLILAPPQLKTEEQEFLVSSRMTWKSRWDCIEAYFCVMMTFSNALQLAASIESYGLLIFIPYIFWNIIVGMPVVFLELMISRYVMSDTFQAWNLCPVAKGVFWILLTTTLISVVVNFLYLVSLIKYLFASFSNPLKWATCDASWNTVTCYVPGKKTKAFNDCLKNASENFCLTARWETSGTQFWKYYVTDKSSPLSYVSVFCILVAICLLIAMISFKDIRSLEKMFIVVVIFPIIMGAILAWVSLSTDEAQLGFKEIFTFKWEWLLYPRIWIEALENTLLFLGLGDLSLTFVSSHGNFMDEIFVDVVLIAFGGFFFSSLFMFPVVSVIAGSHVRLNDDETNLKLFRDKQDVFISISDALILYPFPNFIWAILTYINWFIIEISIQSILILTICDVLRAMHDFEFSTVMIIVLVSSLFLSTCSIFLTFEFFLDLGSVALVSTVLFIITCQLCYGTQKFNYDFFFMMGKPPSVLIKFVWLSLLIFPLVALILKLFLGIPNRPYKNLCYVYVGISFLIYLVAIVVEIGIMKFTSDKIYPVFSANPNWAPRNSLLNNSRIVMASGNINKEFMYRLELNKKPFREQDDFTDQNIVQLI